MFVVEISSTGAEIFCLIVPGVNECLVVRLLRGRVDIPASDGVRFRLVVKALEREDMIRLEGGGLLRRRMSLILG